MAARLLLERQRRSCGPAVPPHSCSTSAAGSNQVSAPICARAVEQVDLLGVEEERLVEAAQALEQLAAHEHAGARHPVDAPRLVVRELAVVEAVEDARARRELAQVEVLGREAEDGREAPARALQAPVGPAAGAGPTIPARGPRLGEADELVDRARGARRRRCSAAGASGRSRARRRGCCRRRSRRSRAARRARTAGCSAASQAAVPSCEAWSTTITSHVAVRLASAASAARQRASRARLS